MERMQLFSVVRQRVLGGLACCLFLGALGSPGCGRDFALPEFSNTPVFDLVVEPEIVRPGQSIAISFQPLATGTPAVTVNGRAANRTSPTEHRYAYSVDGTEGEVLNVRVEFPGGESATAQAFVDAVPPASAIAELLGLQMEPPGVSDRLVAADGAFTEEVAQVVITSDPAGKNALATIVPSATGGFAEVAVGDNTAALLHVFTEDAVGNRGPPVVLMNDIEAPPFTVIRFHPDPPRSGAILRVEVESDPELTTATAILDRGGDLTEASLSLEAGAWVGELTAADYTGPARLELELIDPAGNRANQLLVLVFADTASLDEAFIVLRRVAPDAPTWELFGQADAAPFGGEVEVSTLVLGGSWVSWGTVAVAADGSFPSIAIDRDLITSDSVQVSARIPGTAISLASVILRPDLTLPRVSSQQLTAVGGPTVPIVLEPTTSEPVVDGIELRTQIALATRTDPGGETTTPSFVYPVDATHPDGPIEATLTLIDRANNVATVPITLVADTTGPEISFDWIEPITPLESFQPADQVIASITDAHAPLASATYRAHRLDLGRWWSGSAFDSLTPVDHPIPLAGLPDWPFWLQDVGRPAGELLLELPDQARIRVDFQVEDTVGNRGAQTFTTSRYASAHVEPGTHGRGWVSAAARAGSVVCSAGRSYENSDGDYDSSGGSLILVGSTDWGATWNRAVSNVPVLSERPYPGALALSEDGSRGVVTGTEGLLLLIESDCQPGALVDLGVSGEFLAAAWDGDTAWIAGEDGVYRGDQGGTVWTPVLTWPRYTGIVRLGPGRLLASTASGAFHRSTDGGDTWVATQVLAPTVPILALAADDAGGAFAGGEEFLIESRDGGQSWAPLLPPLNFVNYGTWSIWHARAGGTEVGLWVMISYQMENSSDPTQPYEYYEWWFADRIGGPWSWVGDYGDNFSGSRRSQVVMMDTYRGWTFGYREPTWGEPMVRIDSTVSGGPQVYRWGP